MSQRSEPGIVLVGFMGSGKTTVGRMLAHLTGLPFVDLDLDISQQQGRGIPEIFAEEGETGFRNHESTALRNLVDRSPCVVATGGGIVTREGNWSLLHRLGTIVYLRTNWATLQARLADSSGRPLADGRDWNEVETLWKKRLEMYERADLAIDTDDLSPIEVAEVICRTLTRGVKNV